MKKLEADIMDLARKKEVPTWKIILLKLLWNIAFCQGAN